jgi:hypothetical protein
MNGDILMIYKVYIVPGIKIEKRTILMVFHGYP